MANLPNATRSMKSERMQREVFLREALILTADISSWQKLETMLEEASAEDPEMEDLLSQVRYKLWRTRHRDSPY